jgi:hypothetical protein
MANSLLRVDKSAELIKGTGCWEGTLTVQHFLVVMASTKPPADLEEEQSSDTGETTNA